MKKGFLLLFLVLCLSCLMIFTSCTGDKTQDDIRAENASAGDTAFTISLWVPTNSDTNSAAFKERLAGVEDGINAYLAKLNKNTQIKIIAVNDAEYDAKLEEKLTSCASSDLQKPAALGYKYVNSAEKVYYDDNQEDYIFKLVYPDLLENQADICLIRDYDTYSKYVSKGYLRDLTSYITSTTASYPNFKKAIKGEVISSYMVGDKFYAVPNNHLYAADEYTYLFLNKELAKSVEGFDISYEKDYTHNSEEKQKDLALTNLTFLDRAGEEAKLIENISDLSDYILALADANLNGVVPFVCDDDFNPFDSFITDSSSLVVTVDDYAPSELLDNEDFMVYESLVKKLKGSGSMKESLSEGEKAGVIIYQGTKEDAKKYVDDYYAIRLKAPVATEETLYSSMFAILDFSISYDRSMMMLDLIYNDKVVHTLLQYGVQDVDYTLTLDEDLGEKIFNSIYQSDGSLAYDMNLLYTGNEYSTYKGDGHTINDWDYEKNVNYDVIISPYLHFAKYLKSLTQEQQTQYNTLLQNQKQLDSSTFTKLAALSSEQFEQFREDWKEAKKVDIEKVQQYLADNLAQYNELKPQEETKKNRLAEVDAYIEANSAATDEETKNTVKEYKDEKKVLESDLSLISTYDDNLHQKYLVTEDPIISPILNSESYEEFVELVKDLYSQYSA